MLSLASSDEFERAIAPEYDIQNDPEIDSDMERTVTAVLEEDLADCDPSFEEGALVLCAQAERRTDDDEDDDDNDNDDIEFDDFDDEPDEDDDFDDDEDDLGDDLDDFDGSEP